MRVSVLLFAAYREACGTSRMELDVPEHSSIDEVYSLLAARHERLRPLRPFTAFARNREVVSATMLVESGDELAFLQPASGGRR